MDDVGAELGEGSLGEPTENGSCCAGRLHACSGCGENLRKPDPSLPPLPRTATLLDIGFKRMFNFEYCFILILITFLTDDCITIASLRLERYLKSVFRK